MYSDDSVPDYDGNDDTMVGIVNNSSTAVDAITVSGPGTDLGGLDGDGLCTFIECTWPAPTGYEGPQNTFVVNPNNFDQAEVDFTGGLAATSSTFFSLEGTLTSAVITAREGPLVGNYVALGDSYSSGEGNDPFDPGTDIIGDRCHRSAVAWPRLLGVAASLHLACSGATTANLTAPSQWRGVDKVSQLERLSTIERDLARRGQHVQTVTITVGGNDLGFKTILTTCFFGNCLTDVKRNERVADQVGRRIATSLLLIRRLAPQAHVVLVGYPRLFPSTQSGNATCGWLTPRERKAANTLSAYFDGVQSAAATSAGADFVTVQNALAGHELCTSDSWVFEVNPPVYGDNPRQGHPLLAGQQAIADLVGDQVAP